LDPMGPSASLPEHGAFGAAVAERLRLRETHQGHVAPAGEAGARRHPCYSVRLSSFRLERPSRAFQDAGAEGGRG
jgi:hypothetical protein